MDSIQNIKLKYVNLIIIDKHVCRLYESVMSSGIIFTK